MALTEKTINKLPSGRHTDSRGLYLLVGARKVDATGADATVRTWQFKRRGRWVRIGHWPAWTCVAARKRAQELAVQHDEARPMNLTLKKAHQRWLDRKVPRSPATEDWHARTLKNHFADWLNRDLKTLSLDDLDHRHEQIVRKAGPMAARNAIFAFRAWWRQARRLDKHLPECPTGAAELHPQRTKDASTLYAHLHEWHRALTVLRSPIRKDLYLFGLFTGLRRDDLRTARWEHVRGDVLHVPNPKRPRHKLPSPFDLPLVAAHHEILDRLRAVGKLVAPDSPWIFPGLSGGQELRNVRLSAAEAKAWTGPTFTTHDLRRCFITAAVAAGVHPYAMSRLVNHRIPNVDENYVARGLNLHTEMQSIVAVLQSRLSPP